MKAWQIQHDKLLPININKYKYSKLEEIKTKLSKAKSQLDEEYKKPNFAKYWSNFDPFKYEKYVVSEIGNTTNVSNAWIKCYELINYFGLLDKIKFQDKFLHFDNAAFPGSFILAVHHMVNTLYSDNSSKFEWKASSLYEATDEDPEPLEDKYGLFQKYKKHWLMDDKNNGDVLVESNQLDFRQKLQNLVDLYTSDLGFDVSQDYNNQELLQMPANIGQILTGLLTLNKGGSFITKQYTTFEPITLSIMYATSAFFEEFYICKPYSSREANSETYLVGKGFKGADLSHPYIVMFLEKIKTKTDTPFFALESYPEKYIKTITECAKDLSNAQIEKINADIFRCNKCIIMKIQDPKKNSIVIEFYKSIENKLIEWYSSNPVLPILHKNKLL